ncbi:MAG: CRTAC1 family protein [Bacteroidota bacterium]
MSAMSFGLRCTLWGTLSLVLCLCACQSSPDMRAELARLVAEGKPEMYYHWNAQRADWYKAQADTASTDNQKLKYQYLYWTELLNAGDTEACIEAISAYLAQNGGVQSENITQSNKAIFELLAVAYLRQGELENCLNQHSASSCIIPFQPEALHQLRTGSEKAIELYEMILRRSPEDYQSLWLLNLAYQTLGTAQSDIPEAWRLNYPDWTRQKKDFPRFENVAMQTATAINGLSGGACIDDFNSDGYLDIFATSYGMMDQVRLMLNDQKGQFYDHTEAAGLLGITSGLNAVHADYDNDGHRDILVLRGGWLTEHGQHPNSLLRNRGDGTFEDVTFTAGLGAAFPTQTAAWADFDRDGWLDLFIGNESAKGKGVFCELYRNNGDGTFSEIAKERGIHVSAIVKGVSWGDINNDGWPDLYISTLGGNNKLYKNQAGKFANIAMPAGVQKPHFSFPCWFWDYDNDGWQDILVASYDMNAYTYLGGVFGRELLEGGAFAERIHIYHNNGDESFTEMADSLGLARSVHAMGSNFGDLNNDGFPDFYIGTGAPNPMSVVPNRMFLNEGGTHFAEVTAAGGFGHLQKGHGLAFGDLDRDGDQDIYMTVGGAYEGDVFTNALFVNPGFENQRWISLRLEGTESNRDAIGARLEATLSAGDLIWRQFETLSTGGSFGASSLEVEWGFGRAERLEKLTISWPSGQEQSFGDLPLNSHYVIKEGDPKPQVLDLVPFQLAGSPD